MAKGVPDITKVLVTGWAPKLDMRTIVYAVSKSYT